MKNQPAGKKKQKKKTGVKTVARSKTAGGTEGPEKGRRKSGRRRGGAREAREVIYLGDEVSLAERIKSIFRDDQNRTLNRQNLKNEIQDLLARRGLEKLPPQVFRIIFNSLIFPGIPVRQIMVDDSLVSHIDIGASLDEVVALARECGHSRIPVTSRNEKNGRPRVEGVLYVKDLLGLLGRRTQKFYLNKLLREPFVIPDTFPIDRLLEEFKVRQIHLAIVVDERGEFAGLATLEDVIEEILGDFEDEFDKKTTPLIPRGDGEWEVAGNTFVRDLNRALDTDLDETQQKTVGGLVWHALGSRPRVNDVVTIGNVEFRVKSMKRKTVGILIARVKE